MTKTSHFSPQLLLASGPCCGAPENFSRFQETHGKTGENPIPGQPEKLLPFFLMEKMGEIFTCRFFVTFLGWRKTWPFQRLSDLQRLGIKKVTAWITCYPLEEKVRGKKKLQHQNKSVAKSMKPVFDRSAPLEVFFQKSCGWDWWEKLFASTRWRPKTGWLKTSCRFWGQRHQSNYFWFKISLLFFWNKTIPPILGGCLFLWAEGVNTIPLSQHLPVHIPTSVWVLPRSLTAKSRWKDISHPNRKGNVSPRLPAQLSEFSGVLAGCEKLLGPCVQDGDPLTTISGLIPSYTH